MRFFLFIFIRDVVFLLLFLETASVSVNYAPSITDRAPRRIARVTVRFEDSRSCLC